MEPTRNYHPRPCCPELWPATKRGCQDLREYNGTPSTTHGCHLEPDHDGAHRCSCGNGPGAIQGPPMEARP